MGALLGRSDLREARLLHRGLRTLSDATSWDNTTPHREPKAPVRLPIPIRQIARCGSEMLESALFEFDYTRCQLRIEDHGRYILFSDWLRM